MTPAYATIDGVQRELTAIPAVVGGVQRDLDFLFGTVDGVAREIFASAKHTWKKYEVVNVQKTEFTIVSGETLFYVWLGDSNTSTQSLLASSTTPTTFAICSGGVSCLNTSNKITVSHSDYDALETGIWISQLKTGIYRDYPASRVKSVDARLNWSSSTPYYLVITCDQHAEATTTTEETLVYIEDVAGRDADSYPENGLHTDGYWYVKVDGGESVQTVTVYSNDEVGYWSAVFTQKGSLTVGGVVITSEQQTVTVSGSSVEIIYTVISAMSTARKLYVNGVYVGTTGSSGTTLQTVIEVPESREITITTKNAG